MKIPLTRIILSTGLATGLAAFAQPPGPALSVDAAANLHPISPDVYGINFYWDLGNNNDPQGTAAAAALDVRPTVRRWGGNGTSTYHWKFDVNNIDADWFFEVLPDTSVDASKLPAGSSFNKFVDQARISGGKVIATIPVLGWLPKARAETCSFDVAKYGSQCKVDPYAQYHPFTCGNGIQYVAACGDPKATDGKGPSSPVYIRNDPNDAYGQFDENLQYDWIRYLVTRYGKANQGGVAIWSLDNEPIWWDSTHRDIHPDPYGYGEVLALNLKYAAAIKQADPTALVSGPVGDNWASLWFSKKDIVAGWARGNYWSNPVDRNAHGGLAFLPWYLQQFHQYEQQHGTRLLDYLDLHAYIEPSAIHTGTDANGHTLPEPDAVKALRLDSTREFWDPLEIAVAATAPGLFTTDSTGKGQGAILNDDGLTRNSPEAPAKPGSVVILWGTGEGLTDPPGVDGRMALDVLPKPVAPVSVDIGGLPATVEYAGAAPGNIPGLFQINAHMSKDVSPGGQVPVHVKIGGRTSQDGVTLVVR